MKQWVGSCSRKAHSQMMTRSAGIFLVLCIYSAAFGQGDAQVRTKADALFNEERFTEALPLYSQLISLQPSDPVLSYHYGTCLIFNGEDKTKAVGYLKYAVAKEGVPTAAWYWLGRAYHLDYQFKKALEAYDSFQAKADKKLLAERPVGAFQKQCRNGEKLLSSLKEIDVKKKVEATDEDFFRFYDLSDIGGKIVVLPDELKASFDKKRKERMLLYLPDQKGPIYFGSYGKDGRTGKDIYRTELLPTGNFATPVKVAGYINTDEDEDFPFLHPDGKTFYFSSKGHNSMGGYDVFRASYDRGTGAFGPPENLDFAINTPDDDFLYIVDPEHREACFASGRSSKQGMLHVYRVSTSQVPIVITVLQGEYTSEFDPNDKKARIVVEDAVSRERITEVRTDKDGSYVLALPRSGRFRFLVECGPSGKTHVGLVDVPKNDIPQGYRQELALTKHADLEKLVIRNHFDRPLEGDLIAMALDEIKRRARLDVEERPVQEETAQEHFDIFTRAGFTGEHNEESVQMLADADARELETEAADLKVRSQGAFALSLEATKAAEELAREAQAMADAAVLKSDEEERYGLMLKAAELREDSKAAIERARTAHRTAKDLEAEQLKRTQMAITANRLAQDIRTTIAQKNEGEAVRHLTALKQRVDQKAKPELDPTPLLRSEQAMLDKEKETKAALQRANSARSEEKQLTDRIKQLERERSVAKGNKKIEEIDRQLAVEKQAVVELRKEIDQKFNVVKDLERELFFLRSEYELQKHLSTAAIDGSALPAEAELAGLEKRIATTHSKIASIPVDERFMARIAEMEQQRQLRTYDWSAPAATSTTDDRVATRSIDRSTGSEAERAANRRTGTISDLEKADPKDVRVADVPVSNDGENVNGALEDDRIAGASRSTGVTPQNSTSDDSTATVAESSAEIPNAPDEAGGEVKDDKIDAATERFLMENELAELMQLEQAEKNNDRRQQIQQRKAELQNKLLELDQQEKAAEAAIAIEDDPYWEPVDLERVPMIFNRDTKEEDLVNKLFSEYYEHEAQLKKIADADERANGLHGLELMLSDSIRAEMARQLMVLDLDASQADRILPRVERLRQIRQQHMAMADRYLQDRQNEIASYEGATGTADDTSNVSIEAGPSPDTLTPPNTPADMPPADPIADRFIQVHPDLMKIYHSRIEHRSPHVKEGTSAKEADLVRMDALTVRIDSALRVLTTMNNGKQYDRLRKRTDRLIDDRLIIRTELGQRTAFLTKEEWNTGTDSLRTLQRAVTTLQLPSTEPVLLLAQDLRSKAQKEFDDAARVRKQADRTQDILMRDSLYRRAYSMELQALRELDRSLTAHNYLISGQHSRGEELSYDRIVQKMHGTGTEVMADRPVTKTDPVPTTTESNVALTEDRQIVDPPVPPSADPSTNAKLGAVREETIQQIRTKELALPPIARTPVSTFELGLGDVVPVTDPARIDPVSDAATMEKLIVTTTEEAAMLDRKSIEMSSRSIALRDSANTVVPAERAKVEMMALKAQQLSDSLHTASLLKGQEARALEANERLAIGNEVVVRRIVKYYYLDNEEGILVMENQDLSRFLQLKSIAQDQKLLAARADSAAASNRLLARELEAGAARAEEDARNGRTTAIEAAERSRIFMEKADMLMARADSLAEISSRLKIASNENEGRATTLLNSLDKQRADDLIAYEAKNRRTADGIRRVVKADTTSSTIADVGGKREGPPIEENDRPVPPGTIDRPGPEPVTADPTPSVNASRTEPFDPARAALEGWNTGNVNTAGSFVVPKKLEEDIFALHPTNGKVDQPFLMNAEMPEGLVFKVQVGAFRNAIPQETFSDMTPVMGEDAGNGLTRYTAGLFTTFDQAFKAKDLVRTRGYRDAFVVAYYNGRRIGLNEAMRMTRTEGDGQLANATTPAQRNDAVVDRRSVTERTEDPVVQQQPEQPAKSADTSTIPQRPAERTENVDPGSTAPVTATPDQVPPTGTQTSENTIPPVAPNATPPEVPALSPEEEKKQVLTTYPPSAEGIMAQFKPAPAATTYYPVSGAAPARPVEMIMGLFFTVQVGVYTKPVELEKLYNITPLVSELTETQKIRYSTGVYMDMEGARERRLQIVDMGVKDAFVTAYLNGKRIPIRDARILLEAFGPSILAKP